MSSFEEIEVWKDVVGYEGKYQVSNFGQIKSLARVVYYSNGHQALRSERILRQKTSHDGRMIISLSLDNVAKFYNIHRLVAFAFLPEPEDKAYEINHKDGNPKNNFVGNIEWVSKSYNIKHAYELGLKNQDGEKNPYSKLTEKDVREIRDLVKSKVFRVKYIADLYSVTDSLIYQIKTNRIWKHLEE